MKAILQRVRSASVTVDGQVVSAIGKGVLVLVGIGKGDTSREVDTMARKVLGMKLWDAEDGRSWNRNVQDINGEVLCVSQFTLLATTKKGSKPDFHKSAGAVEARVLYSQFLARLREAHEQDMVKDGVFQAHMDVALINDGPVTIELECLPQTMPSAA